MRALTLRQPWAWAVAHAGKRLENRTWRPPASLVGSWFLIHAGKALDGVAVEQLAARGIAVPDDVVRGVFVAVARCGGWITQSDDPWFLGPFGWVLTEVIALPEPISCCGRQGLWVPPPEVACAVERMIQAHDSPQWWVGRCSGCDSDRHGWCRTPDCEGEWIPSTRQKASDPESCSICEHEGETRLGLNGKADWRACADRDACNKRVETQCAVASVRSEYPGAFVLVDPNGETAVGTLELVARYLAERGCGPARERTEP